MRTSIVILVIVAIIAAGCLEEIKDVGCCNKDDATDPANPKCVIMDSITGEPVEPLRTYQVNGDCNVTSGCNAIIAPGTEMIIPVCSNDYTVPCLNPNCTAMVCGEFSFKPKLAPGYADPEKDAEGDAPANDESAAMNFYKAQCKFLPMDLSFKKIMKSTKSVINVFRLGAGGSFDEFDQYRYYLPMSDAFCALNLPSLASDAKVDRYMNYLQPGPATYDEEIVTNCLTDATAPPPFRYDESLVPASPYLPLGTYPTVVPDSKGYKFARQMRVSKDSVWDEDSCDGIYRYNGAERKSIFKRIDTGYYKRYLASAYADMIYDVDNTGTARAPFECRVDKSECYSGKCDTTFYNRGLLIKGTSEDPNDDVEVASECFKAKDENHREMIFCYPTRDVTINGATEAPTFTYARVPVVLEYLELNHQYAADTDAEILDDRDFDNIDDEGNVDDDDGATIEEYWNKVANGDTFMSGAKSNPVYIKNAIKNMYFTIEQKKYCSNPSSPYSNENWSVYCAHIAEEPYGPPIGGTVFFGKPKTPGEINYHGSRIIGYALSRPTEFQEIYAVNRCGISNTPMYPNREKVLDESMSLLTCKKQCVASCVPGSVNVQVNCNNWCDKNIANPPEPCTLSTSPDKIYETEDYIRVHLDGINTPEWKDLMTGFATYYKDRMVAMRDAALEDCDHEFIPADAVFSAMPWVVSFSVVGKTDHTHTPQDAHFMDLANVAPGEDDHNDQLVNEYHTTNYNYKMMSGSAAQAFRHRNLFDLPMGTLRGTGACNLEWLEEEYLNDRWFIGGSRPFYQIAYSNDIYLFKGKDGEETFGQCKVDDSTKLPVVKELGWCEPCTTSTLAYQKLSLRNKPYFPVLNMKIDLSGTEEPPTSVEEIMSTIGICSIESETSYLGGWCFDHMDAITCHNEEITDMGDYSGISFGLSGTPRTIPDATIIKERLGNYMKSGILPVIDLTDASNWDLDNPDYHEVSGWDDFWGEDSSPPPGFAYYDFEKLFGTMGAVVVIIDTIDGDHVPTPDEAGVIAGRMVERAEVIKSKCDGCMIAIRIAPEPYSNETLREIVSTILGSDPSLNNMVDIVAYNYNVNYHFSGTEDNIPKVANSIQSFSASVLEIPGINKLTMIVGLTVSNSEGVSSGAWTNSEYQSMLDQIVLKQADLIRSGLIGIIFSPVRSWYGGDGFVTTMPGDITPEYALGTKDSRFCALQSAFQMMSTSPPSSVFNRVDAAEQINCTLCSSVDMAQNSCGPNPGDTYPQCDDGSFCHMPNPIVGGPVGDPYTAPLPENFKCPSGSVTNTHCQLCNETGMKYSCTRTFMNSSSDVIEGLMSDVDTDMYLDIIGGIAKPNKCCLGVDVVGPTGPQTYKYTYTKDSSISPLNKPIVYSKAGFTDMDCGFGSTSGLGDTNSFCGQSIIPMKNYDIDCALIPP